MQHCAGGLNMKNERRIFPVEIRASEDGKRLQGTAVVFNRQSENLGGFVETIAPEAVQTRDLENIVATFNHDPSALLGRQESGTLRLDKRDAGLEFEVDLPDTQVGRDVRELTNRGDLRGASFTFTVKEGGETWKKRDGVHHRRLTAIRVHELGPVTFPAYPDTTLATRQLERLQKRDTKAETRERRLRSQELTIPPGIGS